MIEAKCRLCNETFRIEGLGIEASQNLAVASQKHLIQKHPEKFKEYMINMAEIFNIYYEVKETE